MRVGKAVKPPGLVVLRVLQGGRYMLKNLPPLIPISEEPIGSFTLAAEEEVDLALEVLLALVVAEEAEQQAQEEALQIKTEG